MSSIVVPDTCALLKNKRLLNMLVDDFDQIIIPKTVMNELSFRKTQKSTQQDSKNAKAAWQVLSTIDHYKENKKLKIVDNEHFKVQCPNIRNMINDYKVMMLAKELSAKNNVTIIHDDVDFTTYDGNAIRIDEYIAKRNHANNEEKFLELNEEFDDFHRFDDVISSINLNAYLPNGMTLLINTIRCNDLERMQERNGKRITEEKIIEKIHYLLNHGADINKNDSGTYCLPPISHCIQIKESYGFDLFRLLLNAQCDFNKGSRDERKASYLKVGKLNEGNTPLMIACFHSKRKFVKVLCERKGISLNQQDSNGYTALTKCAVQRYRQIQKGKTVTLYEELYDYLIRCGADTLIRDRNNHTAEDWMKRGDNQTYKENEQW